MTQPTDVLGVQRLRGVLLDVGRDLLANQAGVGHGKPEMNPGPDPREKGLVGRGREGWPAAHHPRQAFGEAFHRQRTEEVPLSFGRLEWQESFAP
jgi:hypothetical protein